MFQSFLKLFVEIVFGTEDVDCEVEGLATTNVFDFVMNFWLLFRIFNCLILKRLSVMRRWMDLSRIEIFIGTFRIKIWNFFYVKIAIGFGDALYSFYWIVQIDSVLLQFTFKVFQLYFFINQNGNAFTDMLLFICLMRQVR